MSFHVRASESVTINVRRMARDRLDDAVEDLEAAVRGEDVHANVHEARKRNKHVRSLTRLVRGAAPDLHDEANATVRDAARLLSRLRDRQAVLETLDDLVEHEDLAAVAAAAASVRGPLEEARDQAAAEAREDIDRRWACSSRSVTGGLVGAARRGRRRRRRLREDLWAVPRPHGRRLQRPDDRRLHEWRKRVKYHRYHLRMLEPLWPVGVGRSPGGGPRAQRPAR